jgi:bacillithiol synthase
MIKTNISFEKTGYFSKIIIDYLNGEKGLQPFYDLPNKLASYSKRIKQKETEIIDRATVVDALNEQYKAIKEKPSGIELLKQPNSFTITTGHQLCVFTGPLYFIYKIVNAIKLSQELKQKFPEYNFIPVYWMASEDHDFDEVSTIHIEDKIIQWQTDQTGAVGQMDLKGIQNCISEIEGVLGTNKITSQTITALKDAYLKSKNLAEATRKFVHNLFGKYGVVIIDGNDKLLKRLFVKTIKDEILHGKSFEIVNNTNKHLEKKYKIQVNPREINFFYLKDNSRERIVKKENDLFEILNTNISFTEEEIIKEIDNFPERFSPNVILRPVYQETILPNLAYIGGGGEIAYWLQLKDLFNHLSISFPILVLRNSAVLIDENIAEKIKSLKLGIGDIFIKKDLILNKLVKDKLGESNLLSQEKKELEAMANKINEKAERVDFNLIKSVASMRQRQIKMMERLEQKFIKSAKKKEMVLQNKLEVIFQNLFPSNGLQERDQNFLQFYTQHENFINDLIENFEMFSDQFYALEFNNNFNPKSND